VWGCDGLCGGRGRPGLGFAIDCAERVRDVKSDDGRTLTHVVYAVMARCAPPGRVLCARTGAQRGALDRIHAAMFRCAKRKRRKYRHSESVLTFAFAMFLIDTLMHGCMDGCRHV
jgi:hypothetical protein